MRTLLLPLVLSLSFAVACKKKVEPEPPPEPEPEPVVEAEPEPPPPSCPARDALVGTWYLVTQVSPGAARGMDGINGFYTLEIRPRDVPCEAQVEILKRGYGRGSLSTQQSLKGRTNIRQENNWWQVPIAVGAGGDRTDMTFWLRQGSGRLQGYWYYANNSWGQAPLYGIVEGRRDLFEDRPAELPGMQRQLDSCELKGQPQVSYDDCKPGG